MSQLSSLKVLPEQVDEENQWEYPDHLENGG